LRAATQVIKEKHMRNKARVNNII